uniref:Macaca fascicularis brain cDNA, clone: QflA-23282 n=1 Tax=Macaca fascicularis TaxID=9541 RepID=I7GIW9_MACFA|nr:unnamed protein product [Macaca fascicularis]
MKFCLNCDIIKGDSESKQSTVFKLTPQPSLSDYKCRKINTWHVNLQENELFPKLKQAASFSREYRITLWSP